MLVEAILEKGQVKLLKSIQVLHEPLTVIVNIPDDEIISHKHVGIEVQPLQQTEEILEFKRLTDSLFESGYCYTPEKSDREILEEVLSEKYA